MTLGTFENCVAKERLELDGICPIASSVGIIVVGFPMLGLRLCAIFGAIVGPSVTGAVVGSFAFNLLGGTVGPTVKIVGSFEGTIFGADVLGESCGSKVLGAKVGFIVTVIGRFVGSEVSVICAFVGGAVLIGAFVGSDVAIDIQPKNC